LALLRLPISGLQVERKKLGAAAKEAGKEAKVGGSC